MYRARSRLINFRVTEEEFERLNAAAQAQGARGISDYTRQMVLSCIRSPVIEQSVVDERLQGLEERLVKLEKSISELTGFNSPKGRENKPMRSSADERAGSL